MSKKRVRSKDFIPYEITEWSSADYAAFYGLREDKEYGITLRTLESKVEAHRKENEELKAKIADLLKNKEKEMRELFQQELIEKVEIAVKDKERELTEKYRSALINGENRELIIRIMLDEIEKRVEIKKMKLYELYSSRYDELKNEFEIKIKEMEQLLSSTKL